MRATIERLDGDRPGKHALDGFPRQHRRRTAPRNVADRGEDQNLVGKARRQVDVVRNHERGEPEPIHKRAHQLEQLHLVPQVERHGGLVEDEELGLLREGPRQPDSLVLPSGERPEPAVCQVGRVARDQRPLDGGPVRRENAAEEREVGIPAQEDRLVHPLREQVLLALRHDAHHPRQIPAGPVARRASEDLGTPLERWHEAERRAQQRGFPAAVRPEQGMKFACPHLQRDGAERVARGTRIAAGEVADGDDQLTVHRRSRKANSGTPSSALTMPTGSSRGATTVRATVSAAARKIPPVRNAVGNRVWCSRPQTSRQMCGTISPTKPITPATATAAAVRSEADRYTSCLRRRTSAPRYWAGSSPSASRSSGRAAAARTTSGSGAYTKITRTVVHDAPENPPQSQRNALRSSVASASETRAVVIAAANAPTATPPRSRIRGSSSAPPMSPSRYTRAIAPTAPTNAASGRAQGPGIWRAMATTAPSPAPPERPSRNGSASGFLTRAWSPTPDTPSAPPTRNASTARGNLSCQTMGEANRSPNGTLAGPSSSAAASVVRAAAASRTYLTARPRDAAGARGSPPRRGARVARRVGPEERGTGHCAPRARRAIRDAWRTGAAQRCPTAEPRNRGRARRAFRSRPAPMACRRRETRCGPPPAPRGGRGSSPHR